MNNKYFLLLLLTTLTTQLNYASENNILGSGYEGYESKISTQDQLKIYNAQRASDMKNAPKSKGRKTRRKNKPFGNNKKKRKRYNSESAD